MNLPAKKSLGQHWLDDESILLSIADVADIKPGDQVLEVGPGHGSLTRVLLKKGATVTAVELDKDLFAELSAGKHQNLTVVNQDILKFDLTTLTAGYKVVANIPYYLTSKLLRVLSESANPPQSITLLVQKEVAERICAEPGQMSLLSVSAQVYYDCSLDIIVPADKFTPPPKVDSQVVHMHRWPQILIPEGERKKFFRVVKAGFSNRRKTLENSLSGGLHLPKPVAQTVLEAAGIDSSARAQQLSIAEWKTLSETIHSAQVDA